MIQSKRVLSTLCVLSVIVLISACTPMPLLIKQGIEYPQKLELCTAFDQGFSRDEKLLHLTAVSTFIDKYNKSDKPIFLSACSGGVANTVNIQIQRTRYIEPKKQAIYFLVSTLGIAYPLSGGHFGFFWFGMSETNIGIQLSSDLRSDNKVVYRSFSSSPYFYDLDSVKIKHMRKFQSFLFEIIDELYKER